jgi:hypothetical protein
LVSFILASTTASVWIQAEFSRRASAATSSITNDLRIPPRIAAVQHFGWQSGFRIVVGCAVTASIQFLTVWKVCAETELKAHASGQSNSE